MTASSGRAIILFDGVCNLCNGFVNFVIDRDPSGVFRFAALQSNAGQRLVREQGAVPETGGEAALLQSVMLIENGQVYRRSTAALRIARRLTSPWPLLYAFVVVPEPIRDAVYDWVAAHRYDWFGTRDQCRVPTPALKDRFLDDAASV